MMASNFVSFFSRDKVRYFIFFRGVVVVVFVILVVDHWRFSRYLMGTTASRQTFRSLVTSVPGHFGPLQKKTEVTHDRVVAVCYFGVSSLFAPGPIRSPERIGQ